MVILILILVDMLLCLYHNQDIPMKTMVTVGSMGNSKEITTLLRNLHMEMENMDNKGLKLQVHDQTINAYNT